MSNKHWNMSISELYDILDNVGTNSKSVKKLMSEHDPKWNGNSFDWSDFDKLSKQYNRLGVEYGYFTAIYLLKIWGKPYDLQFIRQFFKNYSRL